MAGRTGTERRIQEGDYDKNRYDTAQDPSWYAREIQAEIDRHDRVIERIPGAAAQGYQYNLMGDTLVVERVAPVASAAPLRDPRAGRRSGAVGRPGELLGGLDTFREPVYSHRTSAERGCTAQSPAAAVNA